jgi:hypothetical protein
VIPICFNVVINNLNCIYCSVDSGLSSKNQVDFVVEREYLVEEFKKIADFKGYDIEIHIGTQGEPLLYAELVELIRDFSSFEKVKTTGIEPNQELWNVYEYTNKYYRVQLVEYHGGKPKFNLPQIAKTLGNIGRTGKGGGGAAFVGNFYWPHSKEKDIWDLFSKNYLKNKYN